MWENQFLNILDYRIILTKAMELIERFCSERKYNELRNCCIQFLETDLPPDVRLRALYYLYVSQYYLSELQRIPSTIEKFRSLVMSNPVARQAYRAGKECYLSNGCYVAHMFGGSNPFDIPETQPLTLSVLIPCYKPHLHKIVRLLESINNQTRIPDQVIISSSQTRPEDMLHLKLDSYKFPVSMVYHHQVKNQAQNRNILARLATTDVVSFIDADDVMHPQRCQIVMEAIEAGAEFALHTFHSGIRTEYPTYTTEQIQFKPLQYLGWDKYIGRIGEAAVQNGHPTLRRRILDKVKYDEYLAIAEEDIVFNYDVFKLGVACTYINVPLTDYDYVNDKKVIGSLCGGLGNQLFIIAKAFYEAKRIRADMHLTLDHDTRGQGHSAGRYASTLFANVMPRIIPIPENSITVKEKGFRYVDVSEEIDNCHRSNPNVVLDGYWQSEQHFPSMRTQLRSFLKVTDPESYLKQLIPDHDYSITPNDCLIMVRRGDYLRFPGIHNPCHQDYYLKAIDEMIKRTNNPNLHFYVTGDDMEYCKSIFPPSHLSSASFTFLNLDDIATFYLGLTFSNFIIANSSYHWFVTYLAKKVDNIMAPDQWINMPDYQSIYRSDMTVIPRCLSENN